jgi:hypothetical protein
MTSNYVEQTEKGRGHHTPAFAYVNSFTNTTTRAITGRRRERERTSDE